MGPSGNMPIVHWIIGTPDGLWPGQLRWAARGTRCSALPTAAWGWMNHLFHDLVLLRNVWIDGKSTFQDILAGKLWQTIATQLWNWWFYLSIHTLPWYLQKNWEQSCPSTVNLAESNIFMLRRWFTHQRWGCSKGFFRLRGWTFLDRIRGLGFLGPQDTGPAGPAGPGDLGTIAWCNAQASHSIAEAPVLHGRCFVGPMIQDLNVSYCMMICIHDIWYINR